MRRVVPAFVVKHRCHVGRDDHTVVFAGLGHNIVGRPPILSAVICDAGDRRFYLIQQRCRLRGNPNRVIEMTQFR